MSILFTQLRWKNFLSTGNIFTEIDLNRTTNTLIVGENGAGKSTILDAVTYVLFGKPFRKINKPQLLNTITRKDMVVEIDFAIGQHKYTIRRGIKPNLFEVLQNDELINQSAEMRDYQEHLEKHILKMNFKSFCQVVMLGSASFVPFMQLPAGQRREIIEDLLDLQIFTTMNSILKDKVSLNTSELRDIASDQKVLTEKIKLIQEHLLEKQNSNEKIIAEKKERIADTNVQIVDLGKKYWELNVENDTLKEQLVDEKSISTRIDKLAQLRHQIEAKRAVIDKDIKFFEKHDNCPTCTQAISKDFRDITVDSKVKETETINDGLVKLAKQYDESNVKLQQIIDVRTMINNNSMIQHSYKSKIDALADYRDELEAEIKGIAKTHADDGDRKLEDLEVELNSVAERYNNSMDEKQVLSAASMLLKDGGIKAKIIKQYIPIINKLINKYLSAMDFFVQFELNEEFNETIKSRFRDEFSYASFSEGEKMRINLAILFTWRAVAKLRNSASTNLLIMDEVFDSSLDSNGTEEFFKILQQLTSDTNTFIISHKGDQLYDKFEKVLKFEKKQNFSRLAA